MEIKSPYPFDKNFNRIIERHAAFVWGDLHQGWMCADKGVDEEEYFRKLYCESFYKLIEIREALIKNNGEWEGDENSLRRALATVGRTFSYKTNDILSMLLCEGGVACIKGGVAKRELEKINPDIDFDEMMEKVAKIAHPKEKKVTRNNIDAGGKPKGLKITEGTTTTTTSDTGIVGWS